MAKLKTKITDLGETKYSLKLSKEELRYIFTLTGYHVVGGGHFRNINNAIFHVVSKEFGDVHESDFGITDVIDVSDIPPEE
jgi:hypothetical protein